MQLNYARVRLYDLLGEIEQVAKELVKNENERAAVLERIRANSIAVNAHYFRQFWAIPAATEKPPVRTAKSTETNKETPDEH